MLKVVSEKVGAVTILHLRGRIVIGQTNVLLHSAHYQSDVGVLVLDLARVTGVDAHGLGVLLELREQTRAMGIQLVLMNVSNLVRHVLEITCLDTVFEVSSESDVRSKALTYQPVNQTETTNSMVAQR
jgi:anti-anti-sigma factor